MRYRAAYDPSFPTGHEEDEAARRCACSATCSCRADAPDPVLASLRLTKEQVQAMTARYRRQVQTPRASDARTRGTASTAAKNDAVIKPLALAGCRPTEIIEITGLSRNVVYHSLRRLNLFTKSKRAASISAALRVKRGATTNTNATTEPKK